MRRRSARTNKPVETEPSSETPKKLRRRRFTTTVEEDPGDDSGKPNRTNNLHEESQDSTLSSSELSKEAQGNESEGGTDNLQVGSQDNQIENNKCSQQEPEEYLANAENSDNNVQEEVTTQETEEGKLKESNYTESDSMVNNVDHDTQNDNVQGTTESPSNDANCSDGNVQINNDNNIKRKEPEETLEHQENVAKEDTAFQSAYSVESKNEKTSDTVNASIKDSKPLRKITLRRPQIETVTEKKSEEEKPSEASDISSERVIEPEGKVRKISSSSAEESTRRTSVSDNDGKERTECISKSISTTSSEDKTEPEAQIRKPHPKIHLVRHRSQPEVTEGDLSILPKPKKSTLWGGSSGWFSNINASLYKIDVDSLKIVCPSIELLKEDEVKLEPIPSKEREKKEHRKRLESESEKELGELDDDPDDEDETPTSNPLAKNRRVSIVNAGTSDNEGPSTSKSTEVVTVAVPQQPRAPLSPARKPKSDVLYITNLVRPFTVKQLKELLQRTGKIVEDGFWTDRIKSKCYVQYETADEAEETRNALHGISWPVGNGKKLIIDYATVEDLEKAKNPTPEVVELEKDIKTPQLEVKDSRYSPPLVDVASNRKRDVYITREWDKGKEDHGHRRSRSRSKERTRKHSRRSYTPEGYPKKHKKNDDSVPQKLMDDLFLKTKTTPSIYWQPLSPEEIAKRVHQRLVRMEEHKRRIEENRERNRDNRHGPYRRR